MKSNPNTTIEDMRNRIIRAFFNGTAPMLEKVEEK